MGAARPVAGFGLCSFLAAAAAVFAGRAAFAAGRGVATAAPDAAAWGLGSAPRVASAWSSQRSRWLRLREA